MRPLTGGILAIIALIAGANQGYAQVDDGLPTRGELKFTTQSMQMQAGKSYEIVVEGKNFRPIVVVEPGSRTQQMSALTNSNRAELLFTATETKSHKIFVTGIPLDVEAADGEASYTLSVKETEFKLGLILKRRLEVGPNDPPYPPRNNYPHKSVNVQMQAGATYTIDLLQIDPIDTYLFIEDDKGTVLRQDDDSGGGLNARIIFAPDKSGTYKVICTTFSGRNGEMELVINAEKGKRPGLGPNPNDPFVPQPFPVPPPPPEFDRPAIIKKKIELKIERPIERPQIVEPKIGRPVIQPVPVPQPLRREQDR